MTMCFLFKDFEDIRNTFSVPSSLMITYKNNRTDITSIKCTSRTFQAVIPGPLFDLSKGIKRYEIKGF